MEMKKWKDEADKLRIENKDLKEIIEMERVVVKNAEYEIQKLNEDVRDRNDIINALQLNVDNAAEEIENFTFAAQRSVDARASTSSYRTHTLLDFS